MPIVNIGRFDMSILIAVVKSDYVALCTDCQHTHMETGLPGELNLPKIECFSENLYIAHGGSAYIPNMCMRILQKLYQNNDITDESITDVVAALVKAYEYMIQEEPDVEKKATSKFIVAGTLDNGNKGLGVVENSPNGIVFRFVEGNDSPKVVIFQPTDMSYTDCYDMVIGEYGKVQSATFSEKVEVALREAVKVVSEKSHLVSKDSLFVSTSST